MQFTMFYRSGQIQCLKKLTCYSLVVVLSLNEVKGKNLVSLMPVLSEVEGINSVKNPVPAEIASSLRSSQ